MWVFASYSRKLSVAILLVVVVGTGLVYGAVTHLIMHQITGFPAARTDTWVVGGNTTLTWTGSAPEFNSSGTFTFPNAVDVTCGGLVSCNVTVTVSGIPTGWTLMLRHNPTIGGPEPVFSNGSVVLFFGPETRCACTWFLGWYNYEIGYTNYPVNGAPPISVTWSWIA